MAGSVMRGEYGDISQGNGRCGSCYAASELGLATDKSAFMRTILGVKGLHSLVAIRVLVTSLRTDPS